MSTMYLSKSFVLVALTLLAAVVSSSSSSDQPAQPSHRRLLQDRNLAAPTPNVPAAARVPSTGSGSFPASRQGQDDPAQIAASAQHARSRKWLYTIVLPAAVGLLLLTAAACFLLPWRKTAAATIGPWKTGLSGQLQKAFVTGTTTVFATSFCVCSKVSLLVPLATTEIRIKVLSCSVVSSMIGFLDMLLL
jgi:hypothetical protein